MNEFKCISPWIPDYYEKLLNLSKFEFNAEWEDEEMKQIKPESVICDLRKLEELIENIEERVDEVRVFDRGMNKLESSIDELKEYIKYLREKDNETKS